MERKILLFLFLCLGLVPTDTFAQRKIKSVYYGEKAGNSSKNPCKGRCIKICAMTESYVLEGVGVIDVSYKLGNLSSGEEITTVRKVVKDAGGSVIREDLDIYPGDVEVAQSEIKHEEIKNGGVVE